MFSLIHASFPEPKQLNVERNALRIVESGSHKLKLLGKLDRSGVHVINVSAVQIDRETPAKSGNPEQRSLLIFYDFIIHFTITLSCKNLAKILED